MNKIKTHILGIIGAVVNLLLLLGYSIFTDVAIPPPFFLTGGLMVGWAIAVLAYPVLSRHLRK